MLSKRSSLEGRIFLFVGVNEAGFLLDLSGCSSPPSGFGSVWIFSSGLKEGPMEENPVNLRFLALRVQLQQKILLPFVAQTWMV